MAEPTGTGRASYKGEPTDRSRTASQNVSRNWLCHHPWDKAAMITSPLVRASETGSILSGQTAPTDPRLTEMSFGDWEGQAGRDLRDDPKSGFRDIENWGWDYRPPNGETPKEVWDRVSAALADLQEDTLIVCHMIVMRVTLAKAYGWDFDGHPPFQIKRDRIYGITIEGDKVKADPEPIRLVKRCA